MANKNTRIRPTVSNNDVQVPGGPKVTVIKPRKADKPVKPVVAVEPVKPVVEPSEVVIAVTDGPVTEPSAEPLSTEPVVKPDGPTVAKRTDGLVGWQVLAIDGSVIKTMPTRSSAERYLTLMPTVFDVSTIGDGPVIVTVEYKRTSITKSFASLALMTVWADKYGCIVLSVKNISADDLAASRKKPVKSVTTTTTTTTVKSDDDVIVAPAVDTSAVADTSAVDTSAAQ